MVLVLIVTSTHIFSKRQARDIDIEMSCDAERCGREFSPPVDFSDLTYTAESGIRNAGIGLFAVVNLEPGSIVGYFGGEFVCVECVRGRKLNKGVNKYRTIQLEVCDEDQNNDSIMYYLLRSEKEEIGGNMWYINSATKSNARLSRVPNCTMEAQGFIGEVYYMEVKTTVAIMSGCELLLDYMMKK